MRPVSGNSPESIHLWNPSKVKASSGIRRFSSSMTACRRAMMYSISTCRRLARAGLIPSQGYSLSPRRDHPEKLFRRPRGIAHQRAGPLLGEPVAGEVVAIRGVEEALVEEGDDARVLRRADQAAGGLHDARHPRHHEGVFETLFEPLVVILLEELLLQRHRRQAGAHDRHRLEHLA